MVILKLSDPDGEQSDTWIFGLSKGNIERLLLGKPIAVSKESHGVDLPNGIHVGIVYGDTEDDILKHIKEITGVEPVGPQPPDRPRG